MSVRVWLNMTNEEVMFKCTFKPLIIHQYQCKAPLSLIATG